MNKSEKNNPNNTNGFQKENKSQNLPNPSPLFEQDEKSTVGMNTSETDNNDTGNSPHIPVNDQPLSPYEERTWAMLAHFSVLLNLITGFLGGIAAIIIYFIYKDRSKLVAYHAMQAFIFQSITWFGAGFLSGLLIGFGSAFAFLILPLLCLIPGLIILLAIPASLIYGLVGGVKVYNGEDFRYWQIGDWVRNILEPKKVN